MKYLHRLILSSKTYQQSSTFQPAAAQVDPDNKWLWRYPRHRLEGEAIRDASLAVAGLLNLQMGGPSIFPELPPGMKSRGGWPVSDEASVRHRRSIYIFVRRNTPYPMLEVFDQPDTHESCPRRNGTISPVQALVLLNSDLSSEWARAFAGRVYQAAGGDPQAQTAAAYRLAFSRCPSEAEREVIGKFFERQRRIVEQRAAAAEELSLPTGLPEGADRVEAAALVDLCHMLLNANEFVYLN